MRKTIIIILTIILSTVPAFAQSSITGTESITAGEPSVIYMDRECLTEIADLEKGETFSGLNPGETYYIKTASGTSEVTIPEDAAYEVFDDMRSAGRYVNKKLRSGNKKITFYYPSDEDIFSLLDISPYLNLIYGSEKCTIETCGTRFAEMGYTTEAITINGKRYDLAAIKTEMSEKKIKEDCKTLHSVIRKIQNGSDEEKVRLINKIIMDSCEYDQEAFESDCIPVPVTTPYGALIEGKAICTGYARAFELLCKTCGVKAEYIETDSDLGGHAFNLVKISGKWYGVDACWNDSLNTETAFTLKGLDAPLFWGNEYHDPDFFLDEYEGYDISETSF